MAKIFFGLIQMAVSLPIAFLAIGCSPASNPSPRTIQPKLEVGVWGGEIILPGLLTRSGIAQIYIFSETSGEIKSCSASFVAQNILLTAAHCVVAPETLVPYQAKALLVRVYQDNLDEEAGHYAKKEIYIQASAVWVHPKFDLAFHQGGFFSRNFGTGRRTNDLALLKLSSPAPKNIPVFQMQLEPTLIRNTTVMAFGFGRNDELNMGQLKFARYHLDFANSNNSDLQLKMRTYKNGLCGGDSGGPLIYLDSQNRPVILGVNSSSSKVLFNEPIENPCDPKSTHNVFVNLMAHRTELLEGLESLK